MASAFSFPYFILSLIKKGKTYYNNYRQERHMKKPKQMIVPEAYREAYVNNEADANKKMALLNVVAAAVAIVIWILYLVRFFSVPEIMYPVVYVLFPVAAALLLSPLFFLKSERIRKPRFKNYLIAVFLLVVAAINAVLPKHGVLGWAVAIVMASHYYNPRFARKIYVATIILMLICIYLGMFFGEYDPHLLSLGVVVDGRPATVDTPEARVELLNELIKEGNNRYVYVIPMYYLPRAALISILFIISNALNRRTNELLMEEIKANTEQEKSKAELNIARRIQMNTLPTEEINTDSVEILGEVKAAKEVGGDLYDFLNIDDDHVAILIGDVSGKGVPAAMFMMKTITSFRDFAKNELSPAKILTAINSSIHRGNAENMFVTCFLAILDKRNGKVVYSNAGHNPPIIGNKDGYSYLKCRSGFLLGCFDKAMVSDEELTLNKGDTITLYTDGVTEARNIKGDFYGEQHFLDVMNKNPHDTVAAIHEDIKKDLTEYVGEASQSDDITLLSIKYK